MSDVLKRIDTYLRSNTELLESLGIGDGEAASMHAELLGQGEHNANYVFSHPSTGERYVLRVNYTSQLGLDDQIGYEYDALKLLEPSRCTPVAYYVDRSKSFEGHGTLVMGFYEGEYMDFGDPVDVAQAARMLADVHSIVPAAGCRLFHPTDPLKAQFEECVGYVRAYRRSSLQSSMVNSYLDKMLSRAQEVLDVPCSEEDTFHILNTEAVPSHFLIPKDKSPGRFLDWEKPILGEVAQDVSYFLSPTTTIWDTDFIFDMEQRAEFVEMYWDAVDGRFERGSFECRFDAYVVMNCLRGITWSCQAWVEYHDPNRPLKNQKTLDKLGTYLNGDYLNLILTRHFAR